MLAHRSAHTSVSGRRRINQDAVLDLALSDGRHVVALADGVGGHRSGEVASNLALEVLAVELERGTSLPDACRAANRVIFEASTVNVAHQGMGTTLVAVQVSGSAYQIVNVGDSRAYRIDRKGVRQITEDHSFVAEAARAGHLSPDEIERSPWRNALTRSVGASAEVDVDVFGPFEHSAEPHVILLCSDGLHDVVSDQGIRDGVLAAEAPETAAHELAKLALERQSQDNVSVALIEFGALLTPREGARDSRFDPHGPEPAARETEASPAPSGSSPSTASIEAASRSTHPSSVLAVSPRAVPVRQRRVRRRTRRTLPRPSDAALFATGLGGMVVWLLLRLLAT
jgi:PPM family protein phosphatase